MENSKIISAKTIIKNNGIQSYFDAKFNFAENFYSFFLTMDFKNVVWGKKLPKLNRKNVRKLSKIRQRGEGRIYNFVINF